MIQQQRAQEKALRKAREAFDDQQQKVLDKLRHDFLANPTGPAKRQLALSVAGLVMSIAAEKLDKVYTLGTETKEFGGYSMAGKVVLKTDGGKQFYDVYASLRGLLGASWDQPLSTLERASQAYDDALRQRNQLLKKEGLAWEHFFKAGAWERLARSSLRRHSIGAWQFSLRTRPDAHPFARRPSASARPFKMAPWPCD